MKTSGAAMMQSSSSSSSPSPVSPFPSQPIALSSDVVSSIVEWCRGTLHTSSPSSIVLIHRALWQSLVIATVAYHSDTAQPNVRFVTNYDNDDHDTSDKDHESKERSDSEVDHLHAVTSILLNEESLQSLMTKTLTSMSQVSPSSSSPSSSLRDIYPMSFACNISSDNEADDDNDANIHDDNKKQVMLQITASNSSSSKSSPSSLEISLHSDDAKMITTIDQLRKRLQRLIEACFVNGEIDRMLSSIAWLDDQELAAHRDLNDHQLYQYDSLSTTKSKSLCLTSSIDEWTVSAALYHIMNEPTVADKLCVQNDDGSDAITYRQLKHYVTNFITATTDKHHLEQLAAAASTLSLSSGVRVGDRVVVCVPRSAKQIIVTVTKLVIKTHSHARAAIAIRTDCLFVLHSFVVGFSIA